MKHMRSFFLLLALLTAGSAWSGDGLKLAVVPSDNESFSDAEVLAKYQALAKYLSAQLKVPVSFTPVVNPFVAAKRANRGEYDLLMAPAHTVASVLKAGFMPVCKQGGDVGTAFVSTSKAPWNNLEDASGAKLSVAPFESLQAGLARGELNGKSIEMKKHFKSTRYFRDQEAALFAIEINATDMAAVDSELAQKWLKTHAGKILHQTASVPRMAFAVNEKRITPEQGKAIESALLKYGPLESNAWMKLVFSPAQKQEFAAISSMLNTTPKELTGARVIEAKQARELIGKGVLLIDARLEVDYLDGHIKGAQWIPYQEISAKEVGFDPVEDRFDLSKLPQDKNAPLMLYCDGTPCWKSYKAAVLAMKNGYRNIYWFRGGYPEWKAAGYPIEVGKPGK